MDVRCTFEEGAEMPLKLWLSFGFSNWLWHGINGLPSRIDIVKRWTHRI